MSIALMTQAWRSASPAGQKMVLLALCDNANDQGECYPSISMLARKCSMAERTVQGHITSMEEEGIVRRELRTGRSTIYHIDSRNFRTPAESAPPQNLHQPRSESAPPPPQNLRHSPATAAPITTSKPSVEPSKNQKRGAKGAQDDLSLNVTLEALGVDQETIRDWIEHRKAKKAPVTPTVLAGMQREAAAAQVTLDFAIRYSIEANWIFFKELWYRQREKGAAAPGHEKFNPTAHVNRHRRGGPE